MGEVIAAFTGTGKTYFCSKHIGALDLVCMPFKYENLPLEFIPERCKADPENAISMDWLFNYVEEIICQLPRYRYVVIPSDNLVCSLLREEGIPYYLCYPDRSLKEEYRKRFLERGVVVKLFCNTVAKKILDCFRNSIGSVGFYQGCFAPL